MHTSLTDLEETWRHKLALCDLKRDDPDLWQQRSHQPPGGEKTSDYAEQLLKQLPILPDDTVLDIGCGDGAIPVRLARMAREVTALDHDPAMLLPVTRRAMAEGLNNLRFLNQDWFEAEIGKEVEPHDIVLASRFRNMVPLGHFLEQMDRAAKRTCYLTWLAERKDIKAEVCRILDKPYHPLPEYEIIVEALQTMGRDPYIDFFKSTGTHYFDSPEAALEDALGGHEVRDDEIRKRLLSLVIYDLKPNGDRLARDSPAKWVIIRWSK